jgi:DNA repair protein RecN (Recombination protein N)
MITQLYIRNYALISELQISFNRGFSTITGETGAGKSIILGALGLALGERADQKTLRNPEEKAVIELTVHLDAGIFKPLFEDAGLDFEPETILRREIMPNGKTRAFVNDAPARLEAIQQIAGRLADIHSQHDTMLLRDDRFQLFLIDRMADNQSLITTFENAYSNWQKLLAEARNLRKVDGAVGGDYDYLSFLNDELEQAQLRLGEEVELEQEIDRLSNAEDTQQRLAHVYGMLNEGDQSALSILQIMVSQLRPAARFDAAVENWLERLETTVIELRDLAVELSARGEELPDLSQLEALNARFSQLQHLFKKHQVMDTRTLMEKHDAIAAQLDAAALKSKRLEKIESEIHSAFEILVNCAAELTKSRQAVIPMLTDKIHALLGDLNMPDARFEVAIQSQPDQITNTGQDTVALLFQANQGFSPLPLHRIASGGELSRVMLALKAVLSESHGLPTIIFDEIDTGISGETAGKVARILQRMGQTMQVLAITHLPQIAAAGAHQYKVYKTQEHNTTTTHLVAIPREARATELARLLGGANPGEAALQNAAALLNEFQR